MNWFFDTLIIAFLIIDAILVAALILELRRIKAWQWKVGIGLALAVIAWFAVFYGSFIEPRLLVVNHEILTLGESGQTLRIALVADFHSGPYTSEKTIERVAERINKENPDAVLLAGDYVFGSNKAISKLLSLKNMEAPLGTYAIMGNHDYIDDSEGVRDFLESLGARVLVNEYVKFGKGESELAVVGVDDLWFGDIDFESALLEIPENTPKILLAHNPDVVYALKDYRFDAILSGHTHGGQIRLPLIGAVSPIPTELGRKYAQGVFDWRGMPLVITSGTGTIGPRARLLNPPEIMILDISF